MIFQRTVYGTLFELASWNAYERHISNNPMLMQGHYGIYPLQFQKDDKNTMFVPDEKNK